MRAQHRPAGVPEGLSPDELERWSNELVSFLTSDGIPATFRVWARKHADLLDAYMASAEDFDADAERTLDSAPSPAAQPSPQTSAKQRRTDPKPEPGVFVLRVPEQIARLSMGAAIGVLALLAIFGVRAMTSGSSGASLPGAVSTPAFNQARADALQALLQQNPSDQDALFELGEINFEGGRFEDAISSLTKLVELDPKNIQAITDIGTANFNLNRPDDAKVWWQRALTVDPNDVQAHYNMGFAYANAEPRDLAAAVNEWETVVKLDPQSDLGQTAKVHVEGLKAQLTATPAANAPAAASTPAAAAP
jgi:Flp pilus assembly protein TadD